MKRYGIMLTAISVVVISLVSCELKQPGTTTELDNYKHETFSSENLAEWKFKGLGKAFGSGGGSFCLTENDSTFGAVLISPESYIGDVIVRYKTMALTSATVLVVMHSASDIGSDSELTLPDDYNGTMALWTNEKNNYFYAFKNGPHNYPPFIRRYPVPGRDALAMAEENFMLAGVFYSIEIGRIDKRLWLTVDGKLITETEDESMLPGGHIVFRIRGTAGFKAACLIKEVEIYSVK